MNRMLDALVTSIGALDGAGVRHAISGNLAAAHHGYIRATETIDLQLAIDDLSDLEALTQGLPAGATQIGDDVWRFPGDVDVVLHASQDALDEAALADPVQGYLPEVESPGPDVVALEPLLLLKLKAYLQGPKDLKHIDDIRKLLARNHDRLDVDELEDLLALDPAWEQAWDELVEARP